MTGILQRGSLRTNHCPYAVWVAPEAEEVVVLDLVALEEADVVLLEVVVVVALELFEVVVEEDEVDVVYVVGGGGSAVDPPAPGQVNTGGPGTM